METWGGEQIWHGTSREGRWLDPFERYHDEVVRVVLARSSVQDVTGVDYRKRTK